jgi:hypothetical protein
MNYDELKKKKQRKQIAAWNEYLFKSYNTTYRKEMMAYYNIQ